MLPNTGMSFTPFDILTANELNDLVENIEALSDGTGIEDNAILQRHMANSSVGFPELASGALRLGLNKKNTTTTVLTISYVTYATVTATSDGSEVELEVGAIIKDGSSGATRIASIRVQCDGVSVTPADLTVPINANGGNNTQFTLSHTPSAGSHTWTLQILSNTGSAQLLDQAYLRVAQVK